MFNRLTSVLLIAFLLFPLSGCAQRWDTLSVREQILLNRILLQWETWMPEKKKEGKAPLITFDELYAGLGAEECQFLDRVRLINPKKTFGFQGNYQGESSEGIRFKRLKKQKIRKNGKTQKLDPQYLPEGVYRDYERMMKAMKKETGRKLLVESGYRSPAYQLYTFLFYLPKHHFSLVETGHWVALPGYSEHGAPQRQAIDFINEEGINGEDNPEEFERLPEYEWLSARAGAFGFELSYPRSQKGITFEPWHWRWTRGINRTEDE